MKVRVRWIYVGYLMMYLSIGVLVVAAWLWYQDHRYAKVIALVGWGVFPSGWLLVLFERTQCISCARCGWHGTKRRWKREGGCPSCGSHLHWS
jgi:hypothetical protein